ncbi:MAG TPA: hypothetical protein PKE04_06150, partial [Clostridia bacterium]|nr:hypothetical protein [Clostridia bacterium]
MKTVDLRGAVQSLKRIQRDKRQYSALQDRVVTKFFAQMNAYAPPNDTGRLRASLQRKPWNGEQEWVDERDKDTIRVGTRVYYAIMVNDGHVIGKRKSKAKHRKRTGPVDYSNYTDVKGWVPGLFFTEKALKALEADVAQEVEAFFDGVLKG